MSENYLTSLDKKRRKHRVELQRMDFEFKELTEDTMQINSIFAWPNNVLHVRVEQLNSGPAVVVKRHWEDKEKLMLIEYDLWRDFVKRVDKLFERFL